MIRSNDLRGGDRSNLKFLNEDWINNVSCHVSRFKYDLVILRAILVFKVETANLWFGSSNQRFKSPVIRVCLSAQPPIQEDQEAAKLASEPGGL